MDILEIDRLCDEFERRLRSGEELSVEEFARNAGGSKCNELIVELCRIERELRGDPGSTMRSPSVIDGHHSVSSGERIRYFGDYELLDEIARGGMGVVFKARQTSLNRTVALKMILAGMLAGEEEVKRFKLEAEAAAQLDHPGIVPIFEIGEHDGQHYFSMGYVQGHSLAERLRDGPMQATESAELMVKICDAVAYAHNNGVIHRDLKPGNVLLDMSGTPKVSDFGLAKRVDSDSDLTKTGQAIGTPAYMAPEQASGQIDQVGPASDVYSLGAILYAMLTGRPPFQAATPIETLRQVTDQEPVSPRTLSPQLPRDLETICLKSLRKEPSKRFTGASDLSDELQRFIAGMPVVSRPAGRTERMWRWCKRNPAVATLITTTAILLTAGTVVSSLFGVAASQRAQDLSVTLAFLNNANVARSIPISPAESFAALERVDESSRDFFWHVLNRSKSQHHQRIELGGNGGYVFVSPRGQHVICKDNRKGALWILNTRSGSKRRLTLNKSYRSLSGRIIRGVEFSNEYAFRIDWYTPFNKEETSDWYVMSNGQWSIVNGTSDPVAVPGQGSLRDNKPNVPPSSSRSSDRFLATCTMHDGRIVALLETSDPRNGKKLTFEVGRRDEGGYKTLKNFSVDGIERLFENRTKLAACRGKNSFIVHDDRSATTIDLTEERVIGLDEKADRSPYYVFVSKSGLKIALVFRASTRGGDHSRVGVRVVDPQGMIEFDTWYRSPNLLHQMEEQGLKDHDADVYRPTTFNILHPIVHTGQFSDDEKSLCFIESGGHVETLEFFSLNDHRFGLVWQAHNQPVIAARRMFQSGEITSIDNTGLVRNWQETDLLDQWQIPNFPGVGSVVARENHLMVLTYGEDADAPGTDPAFGVNAWANRDARISTAFYRRKGGEYLCSLPRIEIRDGVSGKPINVLQLDFNHLPFLSPTGDHVGWMTKQDDLDHRLRVMEVASAKTVVNLVVTAPQATGFSPAGDTLLVLSAIDTVEYKVDEISLRENGNRRQTSLLVPAPVRHKLKLTRNEAAAPSSNESTSSETAGKRIQQAMRKQLDAMKKHQVLAAIFFDLSAEKKTQWKQMFNHSGRWVQYSLDRFPLVLPTRDGQYLDFRHRTQTIRLRNRNTDIIREFRMQHRLNDTWAVVVDRGEEFATLGADQMLRFWSIEHGVLAGSFSLPFDRIDGGSITAANDTILFWGDSGRLASMSVSRVGLLSRSTENPSGDQHSTNQPESNKADSDTDSPQVSERS